MITRCIAALGLVIFMISAPALASPPPEGEGDRSKPDRSKPASPARFVRFGLPRPPIAPTTVGFGPSLDECGDCRRELGDDESVLFSHTAGGVICEACALRAKVGRRLPGSARLALAGWTAGDVAVVPLSDAEARAHQRLLREFFQEHLGTDRELRAFRVWEQGAWGGSAA
jgi:hypothetical protein